MSETMTQEQVQAILRGDHVPRQKALKPAPTAVLIEVPIPPKATHPNARPHWATKAKAKKKQRSDAFIAASVFLRGTTPPLWNQAWCKATFHFVGKRAKKQDSDNLLGWLKATFDGLQDAKVVANDGGMVHYPVEQVFSEKGERRVVLEISGD